MSQCTVTLFVTHRVFLAKGSCVIKIHLPFHSFLPENNREINLHQTVPFFSFAKKISISFNAKKLCRLHFFSLSMLCAWNKQIFCTSNVFTKQNIFGECEFFAFLHCGNFYTSQILQGKTCLFFLDYHNSTDTQHDIFLLLFQCCVFLQVWFPNLMVLVFPTLPHQKWLSELKKIAAMIAVNSLGFKYCKLQSRAIIATDSVPNSICVCVHMWWSEFKKYISKLWNCFTRLTNNASLTVNSSVFSLLSRYSRYSCLHLGSLHRRILVRNVVRIFMICTNS